ncbi:mediator of RNA polymerase II transcription subunit 18-like [Watersipora subatra]|uniref:mediator of RNA polymerase II transcription subunit 18-like n=1 Tax=Watersipora subatra TaxID=2589382 RepID=UPI00355B33BF
MMSEFWNTAITAQVIPFQEWLMQGSVMNQQRETLKHRLEGLCDNTENGDETFVDHEMVYSLRNGDNSVTLHVRTALDHPDMPWHLRYVGSDMNKVDNIIVRSYIEAAVSKNISKFLTDMGFSLDYEYVAKGFLFRRGKMKVTVSTIFKMTLPGSTDLHNLEQVSGSHLVELSVMTSKTEQIEQDMKNFAEQLKPLVSLEKLDHRLLAN